MKASGVVSVWVRGVVYDGHFSRCASWAVVWCFFSGALAGFGMI